MRQIKSKAEQSGRLSNSSSQASSNSSSTQSTPSAAVPQQLTLSPAEIAQLTSALNSLRPQISQIDKLIQLHSKATTAAPEVLKKLIELRNVLVNQIEMAAVKKSFFLTHAQLVLLTEQIQKLSAHLNSRLKESAANSTATAKAFAPAQSQASAAPGKLQQQQQLPPQAATSAFERNLALKLGLSDDFQVAPTDSHFIRYLNGFPAGQAADLRHLSIRNRLLEAECQRLVREEGFRIHRQDGAFGQTSLVACDPQTGGTVTFLLPLLYPQVELLYRIESDPQLPGGLLPSKYEPEQAPFTVSTILRRYQQIKRK